jgi:UDP:flavonoid glycosyltransferase YjiC (YdhE family)
MELTASGTPFVYVPLQHHFEQQFHVRHRLQRYHAGVMIPYPELAPDRLAAELNCLLARPTEFRAVATDGAARAADLLAELI